MKKKLAKLRKEKFTQQHALRNTKNESLRRLISERINAINTEIAKIVQDEHPE